MLVVRVATRVRPAVATKIRICHLDRATRRFASTQPIQHGKGDVGTIPSYLSIFKKDLDDIAPSFSINGDDVEILTSPAEFYNSLKVCHTNNECYRLT